MTAAAQQSLPIPVDVAIVVEWKRWGDRWAMFTDCLRCHELKQCRGKIRRHMVCLGCFAGGQR